jgi:hypothetical protein
MRIERSALLTLSLVTACVQDVDLGLDDAGNGNGSDTGTPADTGVTDTGTSFTCNQVGVECVSACPMGHTPRPDLTCATGSTCCITEATTCNGDPPQCDWCGALYPPTCVGTTWTCDDRGACPACNVDSECGDLTYCDNDFAARTGECTQCPMPPRPPCVGGSHEFFAYGNGCMDFECHCPAGTGLIPGEGCEGPGGWLEIQPETLTFFALPINSIRYAVSGLDPNADMCVTLIWSLDSVEDARAHCGDSSPYVVLTPHTGSGCGQWNYASNVVTNSATGCYDFADFRDLGSSGPHVNLVDMTLTVTSTTFTGGIRMSNRTSHDTWPVSFVFRYGTDVPGESIWIQERDVTDKPSWVKLYADGVRLPISWGCDVMECGNSGGNCPAALREARNVIRPGDFGGSATLNWDGYVYNMPTGASCMVWQPAHPREYTAEFCFGRSVDTSGGEEVVTNLQCQQVTFSYPTSEVVLRVDEGG